MLNATKMGPATGDRYRNPAVSIDGASEIRGDLYRNREHVSMRFMRNNEIVNSGKLETLKRQDCWQGCLKRFWSTLIVAGAAIRGAVHLCSLDFESTFCYLSS